MRWAIADSSRVVQDEYLEWSVSRGARKYTGDIHSVTFTAEGPEVRTILPFDHIDRTIDIG